MNGLSTFISRIVNLGINESNSYTLNDRLKLVNIFTLTCTLFAIPYYITLFFLGEWLLGILFVFAQLLFSASLVMNHLKKYNFAKYLIFVTTNYVVFTLSISIGHDAGFHLYYFTSPLIVFSLFELREMKKIIGFIIFYLSSNVIIEYLYMIEYPTLLNVDKDVIYPFYLLNAFLSFCFLFIMTFNFSKYHYYVSEKFLKSNKTLATSQVELNSLLDEKNILLAELHHRVKNNLAVISGLFNLQINKTDNEEVIEILNKNKARVKSMSLIHDSLFIQNNISKIPIKEYLHHLGRDIANSFGTESTVVEFEYNIEDVLLDLGKAIPCGIITNEIIVNAFKHAFKDKANGIISINFSLSEGQYVLGVKDNGVGLTEKLNNENDSLGMMLIETLVEQLEGEVSIKQEEGTSYEINFPVD